MVYRIFVISEASADIESAASWYDSQRPKLGDLFLIGLEEVLASIKRNPHMYPVMFDDYRRATFLQFPYKVIYHLHEDLIQIFAVSHHKRHPDSWLTRLDNDTK